MATTPPTVAQQLQRFNRWMRQNFPGFTYTQTQAEKLLRDYRMGRASLPPGLRVTLSTGKVLPAKLPAKKAPAKKAPAKKIPVPVPAPAKKAPTKKAPAKKKVLPAKLPAKRAAPRPTPRAPKPIIIRPEPRHVPPARPSRHIYIEDDESDIEEDYTYADEMIEKYGEVVEIGELGVTRWFDDWDDLGNLDVDVYESDS